MLIRAGITFIWHKDTKVCAFLLFGCCLLITGAVFSLRETLGHKCAYLCYHILNDIRVFGQIPEHWAKLEFDMTKELNESF